MLETHAQHVIAHIQSISGIKLTQEQLTHLVEHHATLRNAIETWNGDKAAAGKIANALSQALLGQGWPTSPGTANQGEFITRLQSAAGKHGIDVVPLAD
ncbi:hypothetical protein N8I74_06550 [Chitiniphilus purpureus]|uniref:Uncharacterized protein n=1 Tax=Chitiniphilus purpureus TaxID=2981137 RepID=A0ABY6DQM3_9NEIS|nr:hypothetical protein [Chitiniphilus sp. CD1]UXY16675.1 hypothetical protein N8I74_06550 [Chitiniphilus sp. CD1]